MRYLILSDIHANITALEAALEAAKGKWDEVVCLGDVVGYGPDPNEAVDAVKSLNAVTIRGNHDKAVSGVTNGEDFNPTALHAVLWTREQLRPENQEFLVKLPKGPMPISDFSILHGAVHDEDEYVFAPEQAVAGLQDPPSRISFFGHTHIQGGFTLRNIDLGTLSLKPQNGKSSGTLTLEPEAVYLLNPGSIGQPRDGDPRAAFAIADLERNTVEFWRVPYEIEAVQRRMMKAGLPESLILRLTFGR
jgi:predicted phosphodiesterase